jgi:hypothetical protein
MKREVKEKQQFIKDGGKLEEWQEEDVKFRVIKPYISKSGKFKFKTVEKKKKQKVFYTQGVKQKASCKSDDDHYYEIIDKHKYILKCKYCGIYRKIYPVTYNLIKGKLIKV